MAIDSWLNNQSLPSECDGRMARVYLRSMLDAYVQCQPTSSPATQRQPAVGNKRRFDAMKDGWPKAPVIEEQRLAKKLCQRRTSSNTTDDSFQTPRSDKEPSNAQLSASTAALRRWREQSGSLREAIESCRNVPTIHDVDDQRHKLASAKNKLATYLASHQMVESKLDTAKDALKAAERELSRRRRCLATLTSRMGMTADGTRLETDERDLESDDMVQQFLDVQTSMIEEYKGYVEQSEEDLKEATAAVSKLKGELRDLGKSIEAARPSVKRSDCVLEFVQEMRSAEAMAKELLAAINDTGK
jgi:DNA-binding ferritin-like protein